jgi:hypothetical protein
MSRGKKSQEQLINKNISMTRSLADWLRTVAFEQHRSQAEVVRDALQAYRAHLDDPPCPRGRGSSSGSASPDIAPSRRS